MSQVFLPVLIVVQIAISWELLMGSSEKLLVAFLIFCLKNYSVVKIFLVIPFFIFLLSYPDKKKVNVVYLIYQY